MSPVITVITSLPPEHRERLVRLGEFDAGPVLALCAESPESGRATAVPVGRAAAERSSASRRGGEHAEQSAPGE
ncbi:hypothetical protein ACJ6WF_44295 [Streptomyces sp. MMS24-I2-30]|uniref:hypothetical protein n=1 Tax=Streptomyces sp. MMS24-I2-30 TaxID=3351564 RepID=UPI0038968903